MPIPSSIADLSTTPASNYPAGGEAPNVIDDYIRAHAAIIKQTTNSNTNPDRVQVGDSATAANNFTFTAESDNGAMKLARGNAGATTQDILTVGATGEVALFGVTKTAISGGISATSGSIVNATWAGFRYSLGNVVVIRIIVTIVNAGSGVGAALTLGANPGALVGYGSGRSNITGKMLQVRSSGNDLAISNYDDTTPIANGTLEFSIVLGGVA